MSGAIFYRPALIRLLVLVGGYAGAFCLAVLVQHWVVTSLAVIVMGVILSCLLPVLHEACHGWISPVRRVNRFVGRLAGALLLLDHDEYSRYHKGHHLKFGSPDDPEEPVDLHTVFDWLSFLSPRYFLVPFWRLTWVRIGQALRDLASGQTQRERCRRGWVFAFTAWGLAVVTTVLWPVSLGLYYWLPLWVAAGAMFLTTVTEHYAGPGETEPLTRRVETGTLLQFLVWNTNLHDLHHDYPRRPFWDLPDLARTNPASVKADGFARFHVRALLKLMDSGSRRRKPV